MRIQYGVYCDSQPLHDWPLQFEIPAHGDRIELPSGDYRVIRRSWDLTQPGAISLRIDVSPLPEDGRDGED